MASDATTDSPDAPRATGLAQRYAQALLDLADRRLYAAKHAGRARSVWSEDEVLAAYALFPTPREATRSRGP